MQEEVWKDVIGFEGLYQISNYGKVKALCVLKYRGRAKHLQKERMLKPSIKKNGYKEYSLNKDNVTKYISEQ